LELAFIEGGVMKRIKILIEKHPDGYVAYPVGVKGVVVGQGNTYEEALRDVQSALKFHIETFGVDVLEGEESPILEAFVAEATI
jgi:predicted RNase H-like HicB family nuclease